MKHLYYIAALAATFLTAMPLHAQEEAENDATQQQQTRRRSKLVNNNRFPVRLKPAVGKETIRKIPVYPN